MTGETTGHNSQGLVAPERRTMKPMLHATTCAIWWISGYGFVYGFVYGNCLLFIKTSQENLF